VSANSVVPEKKRLTTIYVKVFTVIYGYIATRKVEVCVEL